MEEKQHFFRYGTITDINGRAVPDERPIIPLAAGNSSVWGTKTSRRS